MSVILNTHRAGSP